MCKPEFTSTILDSSDGVLVLLIGWRPGHCPFDLHPIRTDLTSR